MTQPLLKIEGLQKYFKTTTGGAFSKVKGTVKAVDGIDLDVHLARCYERIQEDRQRALREENSRPMRNNLGSTRDFV